MSRVNRHTWITAVDSQNNTQKRLNLEKTTSNYTIVSAIPIISEKYNHPSYSSSHCSIRLIKNYHRSISSRSSNAFWHRNNKRKEKSSNKKHQRNNSTVSEIPHINSSRSTFQAFRKSIIEKFRNNSKKKMSIITNPSVIYKCKDNTVFNLANDIHMTVDPSTSAQNESQHFSCDSYPLIIQESLKDDHIDEDKNETFIPSLLSLQTEQQNINATDKISQTIQDTSQKDMEDLISPKKIKKGLNKIYYNTFNSLYLFFVEIFIF